MEDFPYHTLSQDHAKLHDMLSLALGRALMVTAIPAWTEPVPQDFPRFIVPGHEKQMASLQALYWLHYRPAVPLIPLWDEWMPMSTLWPARGTGAQLQGMRGLWAAALTSRGMSGEGYVHTLQHDGPAHAEGWPFPRWMEAGGTGWHFRGTGVPGYDGPPATPDGWQVTGAGVTEVDDKGWTIKLTSPRTTAQSPAFSMDSQRAPWLRLNWWASGLERADCYLEWTTTEQTEFAPDRRVYFSPAVGGQAAGETRTMVPVYRVPAWKGQITRLRIGFDNPGVANVTIKSFHTACDTRHNVNNSNFIRGAHDYFMWSRDLSFLRNQIGRVRSAMRFIQREFRTKEKKCIYTSWPGHEGFSGVRWVDGQKRIVPGNGIGSNYWDLLPFGGEDALATIYYYDTLLDLAHLEEQIARNPNWNVSSGDAFAPEELRKHALEVKNYGGKRFWNPKTDRFGTVDLHGTMHDYGFTFLNNEAVYYDFASPRQAQSISRWLGGQRVVAGDTSIGADIYHWRFGPRSTTKRNIDYYFWGWSNPDHIPWGSQVQDGGAVLGWSFHDLMARLKTNGPEDAAMRLQDILKWFDETQVEGGYRAYYAKDPARGNMQGGNVAGGLGLDREFFESILVPQVMLYGFMGFEPRASGFRIRPCLPSAWPKLTITRIHLHGHVLDITATQGGAISISATGSGDGIITVDAPPNTKLSATGVSIIRDTTGAN